jgi:hypothetical protein
MLHFTETERKARKKEKRKKKRKKEGWYMCLVSFSVATINNNLNIR